MNAKIKQLIKQFLPTVIFLVVVLLIIYVIRILIFAGAFKIIKPNTKASVKHILQITSAEDIAIQQEKGLAFISSFRGMSFIAKQRKYDEGIYLCDINNNFSITNLTKNMKKDFHPHGISLYTNKNNKIFLFVINHRTDKDVVEIFEYFNKKLILKSTIFDPMLKNLNDILAIDENSFYATVDHRSTNKFCQLISSYLLLKTGSVILYKNNEVSQVAKNISFANGINESLDKKTIFVASTLYGEIKIYNRDITSDKLAFSYNIPLGTSPDNIDIDQSGDLIIGSHPKILQFSRYAKKKTKYSPSQILQVSINSKGNYKIRTLFIDNGSLVSASSVGVKYKNLLFIGTVYDNKVLVLKNYLQ